MGICYYSGSTLLHKLDPRVKIVIMFSFFIMAFSINNLAILIAMLFFLLCVWIIIRLPPSGLLIIMKIAIPIAAITFLAQLLFLPSKTVIYSIDIPDWIPYFGGEIILTHDGLVNGLRVALRLLVVTTITPLITLTTPIEELLVSLVQSGMPYEIAFAMTTSINLLSILKSDAEEIVQAQKVRGFRGFEERGIINKLRAYIPLVIPVMIEAFVIARQMEIAMKSRAFGAKPHRTFLSEVRMARVDKAVLLVTLLICIVILISPIK